MTPVATLEYLIESGAFASQLAVRLNRDFRNDGRSWYTRVRANEGSEAAEQWLAEWAKKHHYDAYASSIEPVARAILALAKVRKEALVDITAYDTQYLSTLINSNYGGTHRRFVVFNDIPAPYHSCTPSPESYTFGPFGLDLQAVILETGRTYHREMAELTLVIAAWGTGERQPRKGEFSLFKVDTDGLDSSMRCYFHIRRTQERTEKAITDRGAALLGMAPSDRSRIRPDLPISQPDQDVGFPGVGDFMARQLPSLSNYFAALAEALRNDHAH